MILKSFVEQIFTSAFEQAFPNLEIALHPIVVTKSTAENFGHYQCNSAMKLAKVLGTAPREIANKVLESLQNVPASECLAKSEVAGPGFINITLNKSFLSNICQQLLIQEKILPPITRQRVVVDFSSPNVAKEMHVGHLRSTIIGDCLARLFAYLGHDVLRLNHIGDWGTSFGMLIAYIKQFDNDILVVNKEVSLTTLVSYYKAAKKKFDEEADFRKSSQLEVVALQRGEPNALHAWQIICTISRHAYQEIYDLLGVEIIERGESFYNPYLPWIIRDLEERQLLTVSDGAKCLFLEGFVNRDGEPLPFMLQKSDGGYNYATTDLAAIRHRITEEKADRIIYVTDAGQATHFAMLFKAAEKVGYLDSHKVRVDHVPFGVVLGPDGKKFKTRSGETERLIDLLTTAIEKATEILEERNKNQTSPFNKSEIAHIAKTLGINAIKYADLSGNRINDYVFSYEKMLRFEGNTAAFLMYSYVRIHGIKRKISEPKLATIQLEHPSEVALGCHLAQFAEILDSIADDLMPNRLCDYLYELAEKFNAFFRDCRVEGSAEQAQRLSLCELTAKILKQGITLLGLNSVEKM